MKRRDLIAASFLVLGGFLLYFFSRDTRLEDSYPFLLYLVGRPAGYLSDLLMAHPAWVLFQQVAFGVGRAITPGLAPHLPIQIALMFFNALFAGVFYLFLRRRTGNQLVSLSFALLLLFSYQLWTSTHDIRLYPVGSFLLLLTIAAADGGLGFPLRNMLAGCFLGAALTFHLHNISLVPPLLAAYLLAQDEKWGVRIRAALLLSASALASFAALSFVFLWAGYGGIHQIKVFLEGYLHLIGSPSIRGAWEGLTFIRMFLHAGVPTFAPSAVFGHGDLRAEIFSAFLFFFFFVLLLLNLKEVWRNPPLTGRILLLWVLFIPFYFKVLVPEQISGNVSIFMLPLLLLSALAFESQLRRTPRLAPVLKIFFLILVFSVGFFSVKTILEERRSGAHQGISRVLKNLCGSLRAGDVVMAGKIYGLPLAYEYPCRVGVLFTEVGAPRLFFEGRPREAAELAESALEEGGRVFLLEGSMDTVDTRAICRQYGLKIPECLNNRFPLLKSRLEASFRLIPAATDGGGNILYQVKEY